MLLVASGRKTATERKSYDARLMLGGPGTGILRNAQNWHFNSTELKGFVKPTLEFREPHFYERNGVPASRGQA